MARVCARPGCDQPVPSARATYCGTACGKAMQRARRRGDLDSVSKVVNLSPTAVVASVLAATRAQLSEVGRIDTFLGQAALAAADRLDNSRAVQGYAGLLKEYRDTMRAALEDVEEVEQDELDAIRASAALKLLSGHRSA